MNLAFLFAGSSAQNASEQFSWCIQLYFVNFALHPTQQQKKSNGVSLVIQTALPR
jgi:hypothetical protein